MTPESQENRGLESQPRSEGFSPDEPVRWTAKKWAYVIAGVFAIQGVLILLFGERNQPIARASSFGTAVRLIGDASGWERIEALPTFSDSAAFALANWRGFSRDAWLFFKRPEFRISDWTEPPQWLALETQTLGTSLHTFIVSNTMPSLLIADKPLPRPIHPEIPAISVPTQSELRVEGPLAGWRPIIRVDLPSWPHTELLTNTVVHVLVSANGFTAATALLASSGLPEADQFALRAVKETRFRPPGGKAAPAPTSGNLVFKWHTVPATNTLAGPASGL